MNTNKNILLIVFLFIAAHLFAAEAKFQWVANLFNYQGNDQVAYRLEVNTTDPLHLRAIVYSPHTLNRIIEQNQSTGTFTLTDSIDKDMKNKPLKLTTLTLPDTIEYRGGKYPVTVIGDNAYRSCQSLQNLDFPAGLETINMRAFFNCRNLKDIVIPASVTAISTGVFRSDITNQLRTLTFEGVEDGRSRLQTIGTNAFLIETQNKSYGYKGNLILPNSVQTIEAAAFSRAFQQTNTTDSLHLPDNLKTIKGQAFYGCSGFQCALIVPGSVKDIYIQAFMNCNFTDIIIREGVETVGQGAFNGCKSAETIRIPSTLKSIGLNAFINCLPTVLNCYASTPPTIHENNTTLFGNTVINNSILVKIPCRTSDSYKAAHGWREFKHFKEITDIDEDDDNKFMLPVQIVPEGAATYTTAYECATRSISITLNDASPSYVFSHWEDGSTDKNRTSIIPGQGIQYIAYYESEIQLTEWGKNTITIETNSQDIEGCAYTASIGSSTENGTIAKKDAGIWQLSLSTDLSTHPAEDLDITVTMKDGRQLQYHTVIPFIIGSGVETSIAQLIAQHPGIFTESSDIVILNGGHLILEQARKFNDLHIYAGGECTLPQTTSTGLSIRALYLNADLTRTKSIERTIADGTSYNQELPLTAVITINENLQIREKKIYYDITLDRQKQYSLTLPINTEPDKITHANGDEIAIGIIYYDPLSPLTNSSQALNGFKRVTAANLADGWLFERGRCYRVWATPRKWNGQQQQTKAVARFEMPMRDDHRRPTNERSVAVYGEKLTDENAASANWNMLGNPFLTAVTGTGDNINQGGYWNDETASWENSNTQYISVPLDADGQRYGYTEAKGYSLYQGEWFFIQVADSGYITLTRSVAVASQTIVSRAAQLYETDGKKYEACVTLTAPDGQTDRTGILISNRYSDAYDYNADFGRIFTGNEPVALYGISNAGKLFVNAVSTELAEKGCKLGYTAQPANGTFMMSLAQNYDLSSFEGIYLTDSRTSQTVNLLYGDYSFNDATTTDNNRFSVSCVLKKDINTGITTDNSTSSYAWGEQGTLIISRLPEHSDVYVFNAAGQLVYSRQNCSNTIRCAVPQPGCYLIRSTSPTGNQIMRTIIK